jgi:hypothetical protein
MSSSPTAYGILTPAALMTATGLAGFCYLSAGLR